MATKTLQIPARSYEIAVFSNGDAESGPYVRSYYAAAETPAEAKALVKAQMAKGESIEDYGRMTDAEILWVLDNDGTIIGA